MIRETPEQPDDDAAAVRAARDRVADIVRRAVLAEREACAELADRHAEGMENTAILIAAAIRMRR